MYVILCTSIALAFISATLKQISWDALLEHWYLMLNEGTSTWNLSDSAVGKYIADFLVFLILYYGFVPLSVYITMEIVNLFHSFSINWDEQMYHLETNTPANTRTAALAEDLGQVRPNCCPNWVCGCFVCSMSLFPLAHSFVRFC